MGWDRRGIWTQGWSRSFATSDSNGAEGGTATGGTQCTFNFVRFIEHLVPGAEEKLLTAKSAKRWQFFWYRIEKTVVDGANRIRKGFVTSVLHSVWSLAYILMPVYLEPL